MEIFVLIAGLSFVGALVYSVYEAYKRTLRH